MVLWYYVFQLVIFQQVCYRKIHLATGSSTMELYFEAKLDFESSQMFCYIDTLSENVFLMVLWYFVFYVVIFQQVCNRKIPLATGSSTMELRF
jgi:preprotein translocase subunit SecY